MRVDFEQIAASGGTLRSGKVVLGHVVVSGQMMDRSLADLEVEIRIPGKDLSVHRVNTGS